MSQTARFGRLVAPDGRDANFTMRERLRGAVFPKRPKTKVWGNRWIGDQGQTSRCFPAGTKVLMADGSERPIEHVKAGEKVVTHTGKARMVEAVFARRYEGEMAKIRVKGLKQPISATPEHPFFVSSYMVDHKRGSQTYGRMTRRMTDWVPAGAIRPRRSDRYTDYIHVPFDHEAARVREGDEIDAIDFIPPHRNFREDRGRLAAWGSRRSTATIERLRPASSALARLTGLYLAEGYPRVPGGGLAFCYGGHEDNLARETASLLKQEFDVDANVARRPNNTLLVSVSSATLAILFEGLGGKGCAAKRVHPSLFMWDATLLAEVWRGFLDGDGHVRPDGRESTLVTVSEQLARDLFRIGLRIGVKPTMTYSDPKPIAPVKTRRRRYDVSSFGENGSASVRPEIGNHMLLPVKTVESEPFSGLVFNMEVEEDHSYVADFAAVHNCVGFAWHGFLRCSPVNESKPTPQECYDGAQANDEYAGPPPGYDGSSVRGGAKYLNEAVKQVTEYRWATSIDDVLEWLAHNGPVVFGTDWYTRMLDVDMKGFVRIGGGIAGGHAYLVRGYDDSKSALRIQNSWGKSWGEKGLAWLSYDDAAKLIAPEVQGEACSAVEKAIA